MKLNWDFITQIFIACVFSVIITAGIKKQIKVIMNKKDKENLNRFIGLGLVYMSSIVSTVYFYIFENINNVWFFLITILLLSNFTVIIYDRLLKNLLETPNILFEALKSKIGKD